MLTTTQRLDLSLEVALARLDMPPGQYGLIQKLQNAYLDAERNAAAASAMLKVILERTHSTLFGPTKTLPDNVDDLTKEVIGGIDDTVYGMYDVFDALFGNQGYPAPARADVKERVLLGIEGLRALACRAVSV